MAVSVPCANSNLTNIMNTTRDVSSITSQHKDESRPFVVIQAWSADSTAPKAGTSHGVTDATKVVTTRSQNTMFGTTGESNSPPLSHGEVEKSPLQTPVVPDMLPRLHMHRSPRAKLSRSASFENIGSFSRSCGLFTACTPRWRHSPPMRKAAR